MRIFAYLAIYGSVASAEKSKKTLSATIANAASDNSKTIDLRGTSKINNLTQF